MNLDILDLYEHHLTLTYQISFVWLLTLILTSHSSVYRVYWCATRPQGIMLQIFYYAILNSPKNPSLYYYSLCSSLLLLFQKIDPPYSGKQTSCKGWGWFQVHSIQFAIGYLCWCYLVIHDFIIMPVKEPLGKADYNSPSSLITLCMCVAISLCNKINFIFVRTW